MKAFLFQLEHSAAVTIQAAAGDRVGSGAWPMTRSTERVGASSRAFLRSGFGFPLSVVANSSLRIFHRGPWSTTFSHYRGHPPAGIVRSTPAMGLTRLSIRFGLDLSRVSRNRCVAAIVALAKSATPSLTRHYFPHTLAIGSIAPTGGRAGGQEGQRTFLFPTEEECR